VTSENPTEPERALPSGQPTGPERASAVLNRLWQERRFREGAEVAKTALAQFPREPRFGAGLVNFLLAAGDLAKAEEAARSFLADNMQPDLVEEVWIALADAVIRQERAEEARAILRDACLAFPASVPLQARRGRQAMLAQDYAEAVDALQIAADLAPEREVLHTSLLSALWQTQRYAVGSKMAARAVQFMPQSAGIRLHLANFLFAENRSREAAAVAREAIELDPTSTRAHWVLVDALWRQDRYNESFRMLQAALERFPTEVFLLRQVARLAPAVFQEEAIVPLYRRAIGLAEMPRGIWETLIRCLIKQGEFVEAADTARRAMLVHPAAPEFGALLAEILLQDNRDQETIAADIATVLGVETKALPVQIALISGLLTHQKWDEASSLLEGLRSDAPDEPELLLRFGIALTGKGAIEEAVAILAALAEKHPENAPAWEALCDAYREAKQIKPAVAAYRRLEALGASVETMRRVQVKLFGEQIV
jgi:tetratricopeptide (TPR) repeat protein